jgi:hypothetical protein
MSEHVTHAEHTAALELVGADIDAVREDLAQLTENFGGVLAVVEQAQANAPGATEEPDDGGQWCWRTLAGEDRVALWAELRGWIDWFNGRYGAAGARVAIPPCWPQHPVVVEELTGLMVAWQSAHGAAKKPSDSLVAWHDRWLWPCLERLYTKPGGFKDCVLARHDLRHTVVVPAVADDVFDKIVRDDLATIHPDATAGVAPRVA